MGIGPLTEEQVTLVKKALAERESGGAGDLYAVNQLGYLGRYQFGVPALEDTGYIKSGVWRKFRSNDAAKIDSNWTGKNGVTSKMDFLGNEKAQEDAMTRLMKQNYKIGLRKGALTEESTEKEVAGFLAASHLGGAGNASRLFVEGKQFADANGTELTEYVHIGENAIV